MGSGLYGIGLSGLAAAHAGLVTTGHNIANADTPGFHRQATVQANANPYLTGGGFIGQGVEVQTVRRIYNDYLETQVGRMHVIGSSLYVLTLKFPTGASVEIDPFVYSFGTRQ